MRPIDDRANQLTCARAACRPPWLPSSSTSPPAPSIAGEVGTARRSLATYGTDEHDFARISDLLTNNPLIKDGPTYDEQRLSGDALQQLFLQLLRDEMKAEDQDGREDGGQATSRKRKIQTPPLPSFKDAQQHKDKLPFLVDRLYARYRSYMVRAIQEDEKRYAEVQAEIEEIERGEWDERILKDDQTLANRSVVATADIQLKANGVQVDVVAPEVNTTPAVERPALVEEQIQSAPITKSESHIELRNAMSREPTQSSSDIPDPPQLGNETRATDIPRPANGPSPVQTEPQKPWKWETPYNPPPPATPQAIGVPYQFNSQPPHTHGYAAPPRGSFPTHSMPVPQSASNSPHSPAQGVLLPPPNGIGRSPTTPGMPLDALADLAGQQYRAPSGSPLPQQYGALAGQYVPPYLPQARPIPANGTPQWTQPYAPAYSGQSPQFPYPPTQRPQFPPRPDLIQSENRQYTSPYNGSHGPRPPVTGQIQTPKPRPSLPHTPFSQGGLLSVTGSGTKWTPRAPGASPGANAALDAPQMEPLSPVLLPKAHPETMKRSGKKQIKKPESKVNKAPKRGAQRTRAGSTTSSVIAGSYRSQSVLSHADEDELSLDNDVPSRHVKEEVATPAGIDDAGDTTADESSAIQRLPSRSGPSPRNSTKRKRASSIPVEARSNGPPGHVMWTKAFPKISIPALDSISGHRNASTFAAPVKGIPGYTNIILRPQDLKTIRTAIHQGSRAAIAVAPDDMSPNASNIWLPISEDLIPPKGIINYAQLEKELMRMFANAVMFNADPDRGFGKSWQGIGKGKGDVVGYEIDEDGVIKDTRAMFLDVEKVVGSLRSAERRSEEMRESSMARAVGDEDEVDELAGDGESHAGNTGSIAKRRRKG